MYMTSLFVDVHEIHSRSFFSLFLRSADCWLDPKTDAHFYLFGILLLLGLSCRLEWIGENHFHSTPLTLWICENKGDDWSKKIRFFVGFKNWPMDLKKEHRSWRVRGRLDNLLLLLLLDRVDVDEFIQSILLAKAVTLVFPLSFLFLYFMFRLALNKVKKLRDSTD